LLANSFMKAAGKPAYFYGLMSDQLRRVQAIWSGSVVDIVYYVRRQDEFLLSIYLELLATGHVSVEFDAFLEAQDLDRLSWLRVLNDLASGFGREHLVVGLYDELRDGATSYLARFLDRCGIDGARVPPIVDPGVLRPALSAFAYQLAARSLALEMAQEDRLALFDFLRQRLSGPRYERAKLLSDGQRKLVMGRCRSDNIKMFDEFFPGISATQWDVAP
jgi:hypothetical protein